MMQVQAQYQLRIPYSFYKPFSFNAPPVIVIIPVLFIPIVSVRRRQRCHMEKTEKGRSKDNVRRSNGHDNSQGFSLQYTEREIEILMEKGCVQNDGGGEDYLVT
jgi:hypothetical protein